MRGALAVLLLVLLALVVEGRRNRPSSRRHFRARNDDDGETYVVLVAGSNGWYNYRHQADIAHAYHTIRNHGIPEDNIITMMYDDVANNQMNPYKGKLFNRPHGKDVYQGLKIDYRGKTVTPDNFLNVLKGNADAILGPNKKVLKTTEKDRIFIYFTDHGAVGLIAFPDEMLSAKQLNDALVWMHKNKKYSQLVFYLEACESGSMFEDVLRKDLDIYAITAANSHESSWGTFCDNDMGLPCLGDLFSVNWISDSDEEDLSKETLQYQYDLVKRETNLSHVMQFGDVDIASEAVGLFQGEDTSDEYVVKGQKASTSVSWPSRDIELNYLVSMTKKTNDLGARRDIHKQIMKIKATRKAVKRVVHSIVDRLFPDETSTFRHHVLTNKRAVFDLDCHHVVTKAFGKYCINFNKYEYALKYANVLNNICIELGTVDAMSQLPDLCMDVDIDAEVEETFVDLLQ